MSIGSYKRMITLPYTYANLEVKKAEMNGGWLRIIFKKEGKLDGQKGSGKKGKGKGKRSG